MHTYAAALLVLSITCCAHAPPAETGHVRAVARAPDRALAATVRIAYDVPGVVRGMGSGIAWGPHAIVTAKHVLPPVFPGMPDGPVMAVTTYDDQTCDVVSATRVHGLDIAVLRVEGCELEPLAWYADAPQGATVWAAGHPLGLDWSVTRGVVSAVREDALQVDAPVNKGMSGGPVVDDKGRLVGMTVALSSKDGQWAGIGWVIPTETLIEKVGCAC